MKTNELNNGIKDVYTKPALEVEEMEVQWNYLSTGEGSSTGGSSTFLLTGGRNSCGGCGEAGYDEDWDY